MSVSFRAFHCCLDCHSYGSMPLDEHRARGDVLGCRPPWWMVVAKSLRKEISYLRGSRPTQATPDVSLDNLGIPPDNEFLLECAQFAAKFLAEWPCPAEFSRPPVGSHSLREEDDAVPCEGAFSVGEQCGRDEFPMGDLVDEQHHLIDVLLTVKYGSNRMKRLGVVLQRRTTPSRFMRSLREHDDMRGGGLTFYQGHFDWARASIAHAQRVDEESEALDGIIKEIETISSQEKLYEPHRANTMEEPAAIQAPLMEPPSGTVLAFGRPDGDSGDDDDSTRPDLRHEATKVAVQTYGQDSRDQANTFELTNCGRDTLPVEAMLGSTKDEHSTSPGAELAANASVSVRVSTQHKVASAPEDAPLANYSQVHPTDPEHMLHDSNTPTKGSLGREELGSPYTEEHARVATRPYADAKLQNNKSAKTGFIREETDVRDRPVKAPTQRESSSCSQRLSLLASTGADRKGNVAVVAPCTILEKQSEERFPATNAEKTVIERGPLEFNDIFECDFEERSLPESSEPDLSFGDCATVEFQTQCDVTEESTNLAKSMESIAYGEEEQTCQTEGASVHYSSVHSPSEISAISIERCFPLTLSSGSLGRKTHPHPNLVGYPLACSSAKGVGKSSTCKSSPQTHNQTRSVGFPTISPPFRGEDSKKHGTMPQPKGLRALRQDELAEGWCAKIFDAVLGEPLVTESIAQETYTTGNVAFGSPEPDGPIIDEERIALQPLEGGEVAGTPFSADTDYSERESEERTTHTKPSSVKTCGNIRAKFLDNFQDEGSPRRQVRLERLKENVNIARLGVGRKIGDWYKPLSSSTGQPARAGTSGTSSALEGRKIRRVTRMLDSSRIFGNKCRRKPLCDQSNRITRYFPAKKCTMIVPCVEKTCAPACDLGKFRYNRFEARARPKADIAAYPTDSLAEGALRSPCVGEKKRETASHGIDYSGAESTNRYFNAMSTASRDTASLLGQGKQPACWETGLREMDIPDACCLKLTANTCAGTVRSGSGHSMRTSNNPEICMGMVGSCSEKSSDIQMVRTCDASHTLGAKRSRFECDMVQSKKVASNALEKNPRTPTDRPENRALGYTLGCLGLRSTGSAKFRLERTTQEQADPRHASREADDCGGGPSRSRSSIYEAGTFNGVRDLAELGQRTLLGQSCQELPGSTYRNIRDDQNGISTKGMRELELSGGRDASHEVTTESDTKISVRLAGESYNERLEDYAVDGSLCERDAFDGLEDYDDSEEMVKIEGGIETRRNSSWDRHCGTTVQATKEDKQRVLGIIRETLQGGLLRTPRKPSDAQATVLERARFTPDEKSLCNAAEPATPANRDSEAPSRSAIAGALDSTAVQRERWPENATAAVAPMATAGQDEKRPRPSLRWPGHLNVRNLASKLVTPHRECEQVDTTVVEQLLNKPAKNQLATNFMAIRGVKLQSPIAITKSPPTC
ncbi:hypothetical protein HPB50_027483 [Hyalomma asiaticum]|uniref:Uncharacterized protein n=1 Tax=Hyalomma asiaticum TaxID=266040 RepID=A0ACB7TAZ4_HYAAI|nr:hypothetical protein HPB50_027483 [Hyalomma asiaticum]